MPCSLFIRHIYYKGDLKAQLSKKNNNKKTTQRDTKQKYFFKMQNI